MSGRGRDKVLLVGTVLICDGLKKNLTTIQPPQIQDPQFLTHRIGRAQ